MKTRFRQYSAVLAFLLVALLLSAASTAGELPDFTSIVAKNGPSVVHVEAKYEGQPRRQMHQQMLIAQRRA